MKKTLVVSIFLALGSIAQATIITAICNPNPLVVLGQSGGGNEVCSFSNIPNGSTINTVTAEYVFDFQFNNFDPGTKTVDFSFTGPGTYSFASTATLANRPLDSGIMNVASADFSLFTGASFSVVDSFTGASTAITGGTFSKNFTLDYTAASNNSSTPEPQTYAMMGVGLSLMALARRK